MAAKTLEGLGLKPQRGKGFGSRKAENVLDGAVVTEAFLRSSVWDLFSS